jgi:dipeptide/tripeptide permease
MTETIPAKPGIFKSFSKNFWTVIVMEFFERGSYYGVRSILSVYLVLSVAEGGLGFSKESVGIITSTFQPLLYLLPILAGAIADRFGYRKTLVFAFTIMSLGYLLTGLVSTYSLVFTCLILMVVGAGTFKPIISGTIARVTDKTNFNACVWNFLILVYKISVLFFSPLILVPMLKQYSYYYVFINGSNLHRFTDVAKFFVYKEPMKFENIKPLGQVLTDAVLVIKDFRFILMIVIYSGFWILYFHAVRFRSLDTSKIT